MLEALAAGIPTIAFEESIVGTKLVPDRHVLIANHSIQAIQNSIQQLLNNESQAHTLSQEARRLVEAHSDWSVISNVLEENLVQLGSTTASSR